MATYYKRAGSGAWNTAATWSTIAAKDASRVGDGAVPTIADIVILDDYSGDLSVNITTGVCLDFDENTNGAYAGTLSFTSTASKISAAGTAILIGAFSGGGIISVLGNITLAGACTGSCQLSKGNAAATITSNGNSWPGDFLLQTSNKITTLKGQWVISGNTYITTGGQTLNKTGVGDGDLWTTQNFDFGSGCLGTTNIKINGIWSGASVVGPTNNITLGDSATISGTVYYNTGTLACDTNGTGVTTTGSTLILRGSCILTTRQNPDTNGITFNNVQCAGTTTLGSNLKCSGDLKIYNTSFVGAYNISCGTLYNASTVANVLVTGQTLTVTTGMLLVSPTIVNTNIMQSSAASATYLNYIGALSAAKVFGMFFTYINATGREWVTTTAYKVGDLITINSLSYICLVNHTSGTFATDLAAANWLLQDTKRIDNWYGGTLSNTTNIYNRTSADIAVDVFGWL